MAIPGFAAQASLYQTTRRYRSTGFARSEGMSGPSIMPAYFPGPSTQANCNRCNEIATRNFGGCLAIGATGCGLGCIAAGPFYPACFAACMGGTLGTCNVNLLREVGMCLLDDCCPKRCGPPDLFDLAGSGCCDEGERCVDQRDPNSRQGCCPSDQNVCGGRCCAPGERCCGEDCCPPHFHCIDGVCTQYPSFGRGGPPAPPRRFDYCLFGHEPCMGKCCPPGLQCCPPWGCMTSCLH